MTTYSIQYNTDGQIASDEEVSRANTTESPLDESGQGRVEPQIRMGGEASRITFSGDKAKMETIGQIEAAPVSDMQTAESVVASGRSASGGPRAASMLRPNDIVAVNGMETSVKVAQSMGLIRPAAGGGYEDVAEARTAQPQQQGQQPRQQQRPDTSGDMQRTQTTVDDLEREMNGDYEAETLTDQNVEHLNTAIVNTVDAHIIERGLQEAVETGEFSENVMAEAATKLGMTEDQAKAAVNDMRKAYTQQLSNGLASAGLEDPQLQQEFQQWLSQSNPGEFKAARRALFERSTAKGFSKHLSGWMASLGTSDPKRVMQIAKASGYKGRIDNGKAVIEVPGVGEMSWKNAVSQGYIRPVG